MGAIEVLAVILAVVVLLKILLWLINPNYLLRVAEGMSKNISLITTLFVMLIVLIGYFIFLQFSIIEVAALLLFSTLLIGTGLLPLYQPMLKSMKPLISQRFKTLRTLWLAFLIWGFIALWVLYTSLW